MVDVTTWKLEQLSDRLASLLSQEKNPQPKMEALARRMREEGLTEHSPAPKETPQTFARTVIAENPQMYDEVADLPLPILLPLVLSSGILCGALWAFIAAWLLYRFNIHEILSTVLLNFISFQVLDYVATEIWRDPLAGHPTTIPIGAGGVLPRLINSPPLHSGLILVIIVAVLAYVLTDRTSLGYELIATGANPKAARVYGINTRTLFLLSLVLGGAMAGLAGAIEVAGVHRRLIEGLQSNFLSLGIIIGLISKGNHAVLPFVALFIAILEVGASAMQRTMAIPVEMVFIVEALILISVLLTDVVRKR